MKRRDFLAKAAKMGAGLVLAPAAVATAQETPRYNARRDPQIDWSLDPEEWLDDEWIKMVANMKLGGS